MRAELHLMKANRMKKFLYRLLLTLGVLVLVLLALAAYNRSDRHPGYHFNLHLPADPSRTVALQAGFGRSVITPELPDTWIDADSNGCYEPDRGDRYLDRNQNGRFDAFWLAGFHNNRPARAVHDDLWARAMVLEDGHVCVALVSLDAIGFFHDYVVDVRAMLAQKPWKIDHLIICSTHNHETPDLMGLWGPAFYRSGVNKEYLRFVQRQIVDAVGQAYANRTPATLLAGRIDSTAADLVRDSRPPRVMDDAIHLLQFRSQAKDSLLGVLLNWGNHPETLSDDNLDITADFPYYWLQGIEQGIVYDGKVQRAGLGGMAVFANGCVGGHDYRLNQTFKKASFAKARSQGYRLADLVLDQFETGTWETVTDPRLGVQVETITLKVDNFLFNLAGALRVLDRGFSGFNKLRSEVSLVTIGDAVSVLMLPGEIYPEIVNGGAAAPEGGDFGAPVIESPGLRRLMPGRYKLVIGLANDEIGYVLPRSQWDEKKPYTYGAKKAPYGEINSLGPDTGPQLYRTAKRLIEQIKIAE